MVVGRTDPLAERSLAKIGHVNTREPSAGVSEDGGCRVAADRSARVWVEISAPIHCARLVQTHGASIPGPDRRTSHGSPGRFSVPEPRIAFRGLYGCPG